MRIFPAKTIFGRYFTAFYETADLMMSESEMLNKPSRNNTYGTRKLLKFEFEETKVYNQTVMKFFTNDTIIVTH